MEVRKGRKRVFCLGKEVRKAKTTGTGKVLGQKKKKCVRTVFDITDTKINPILHYST